jgi:hypothetical protein
MRRFLSSVLIGIGIGLLIAPMPGEEMRRLLNERLQGFLGSSTGNRFGQQASDSVSPTERNLRDIAKEAEGHKEPHSLIVEPFTPSYPEYVNPETNPGS